MSGWRLEGGVDFTFEPGTVIPANGSLYVSPNVVAFKARTVAPRGGQGPLVIGNYRGISATSAKRSGSSIPQGPSAPPPLTQALRALAIITGRDRGHVSPGGDGLAEFIESPTKHCHCSARGRPVHARHRVRLQRQRRHITRARVRARSSCGTSPPSRPPTRARARSPVSSRYFGAR